MHPKGDHLLLFALILAATGRADFPASLSINQDGESQSPGILLILLTQPVTKCKNKNNKGMATSNTWKLCSQSQFLIIRHPSWL
jgi:hypothetical protein